MKTVTSLARAAGSPASGGEEAGTDQQLDQAQPDVQIEISARPEEQRPGGRRFGALVHAILASIGLDAGADAIQASAAVQGRMFDATDEEIAAAITTVRVALQHPILRRAAASTGNGEIRRETPVLLTLDDGSLAEGALDLAFRDETADFNGWTVVDFKTDQEFAKESDHYKTQVRFYARAVQAATGLPARGIVLVV